MMRYDASIDADALKKALVIRINGSKRLFDRRSWTYLTKYWCALLIELKFKTIL